MSTSLHQRMSSKVDLIARDTMCRKPISLGSDCRVVVPLVQGLIEKDDVGEEGGGLGVAEVEMDSVLIEDLPLKST